MSFPKEPTFFGNEGTSGLFNGPHDEDRAYHSRVVTTIEDYGKLFDGVKDEKALGEASIYYLYLPKAPEQIKKYVPNVKMFAVLRNPADRAYSAYLHVVRQAREKLPFAQSLAQEDRRIRENWNPLWHFKAMGFYSEQVRRYYDMFGREQVKVYLYEDLQKRPLAVIKEILDILEIDNSFVPDMSKRYKESYVPRLPKLEMALHKTRVAIDLNQNYVPRRLRWKTVSTAKALIDRVAGPNRMTPPPIPEADRAQLLEEYRDDIFRLGDLIGRDLSHWCSPVGVGAKTAV